jgi:acetylornithine deacetylase/succinyl-diaminopimelate desuccinylase-like protein
MNYENYKSLLKEFVSFKSISTDENYKSDVAAVAKWLYDLMSRFGLDVKLVSGYGNDIVLGKYVVSPDANTVLIYGHYDVQPASKEEGWKKDPFELYEDDNKLYARGVVDNKGQILIHLFTVIELIQKSQLRYNVVFMIEGNEETGSPLLDKFVQDYVNELKCDFVFFSDGELTMSHPVIETGFRGIVNVILKITTSQKDNHSGLYGGTIPNAAHVLSRLIADMHDDNGVLMLPGLDNTVEGIDKRLVKDSESIPFDEDTFLRNTGAKVRFNNKMNFYLQNGYLTSAEVTTLSAGYLGEGFRNAIPGTAIAKINFRISPKHSSQEVLNAFENYLQSHMPSYADYSLEFSEACEPILIDVNNAYASELKSIAHQVYGKDCYFKLCGAIVPVAGTFQSILKVPVISLGLGNEDCNMHGVNENYDIELIKKGLYLSNKFLSRNK